MSVETVDFPFVDTLSLALVPFFNVKLNGVIAIV